MKVRLGVRSPRLALLPFLVLPFALAFLVPALASGDGPATGSATVPTIEMKLEGKKLSFAGPESIVEGEELRVVNKTNPAQVGPHTFSLVTKGSLPKTAKARKTCFTPGKICMGIAHWYGLKGEENPKNPILEVGGEGWDTMGTVTKKGDSWFTSKKGGSIEEAVSAKAGTTLYFICAVHPWMQGSIKVLPKPAV